MTDFKNTILNKIEKAHIKPKSRKSFFLKRSLVWAMAGISVILGSLGSSLVIFALANNRGLGGPLSIIPILWVVVMGVFLLITYYNVRHTKGGYRYSFWLIFVVTLLISLVAGISLYASKMSAQVDQNIARAVSGYSGVEGQIQKRWVQPQSGVIAGQIMRTGDTIEMQDFSKQKWTLTTENLSRVEKEMFNRVRLVRVIGYDKGDQVFDVCAALPWKDVVGKRRTPRFLEDDFTKEGISLDIFASDEALSVFDYLNISQSERNLSELRSNVCRK